MNYPCKLIQDLLPLYHDGVCSEESRSAVEEHLLQCAECSAFSEKICQADNISMTAAPEREMQKADSLKKVKRKILKKQILTAAAVLTAAIVIWFGISIPLKLSENVVKSEKISVSMQSSDLTARLHGGFPSSMHIKNVEINSGEYYMFFNMSESKWDRLTTPTGRYTDTVLAYNEKSVGNIERVYYYGGDLTGIEMLSEEELNNIIEQSTLMWSK